MLKITRIDDNRLDLDISGKIDADAMARTVDELLTATENMNDGSMLYRILDIQMPTVGAIGVEIKQLPALFRMLRKVDRIAVLSDKGWIRKWAEVEGRLIPGLKIKAFNLTQEREANNWLAD